MLLDNLIKSIATLPGLGSRSAVRIVLYLLSKNPNLMSHISSLMKEAFEKISPCSLCGNLSTQSICEICSDPQRDKSLLCIISSINDLWNIENSKYYNGLYHVLQNDASSDISNFNDIEIKKIRNRINSSLEWKEIIIANSTTISGQTTTFFLSDAIKEMKEKDEKYKDLTITTLGKGIPVGSEIDYLDESTIKVAFTTRTNVGDKE